MADYPWFGHHPKTKDLDQGLILPDFPIPDYANVDYESLASDDDVELSIEIKKADLIVVTQACDIENNKVKNITLCRLYPLSEYLVGAKLSKGKANKLISSLNSDRVTNMMLLPPPEYNPYGSAFGEFLVVKFDESVNYPVELVKQRVDGGDDNLMKLLPPYREGLSQNYGIFFMRVGNPENRERLYPEVYQTFRDILDDRESEEAEQ